MKTIWAFIFLCAISSAPAQNVKPQLNLNALAEPLQDLTPQDRKTVDEALKLIQNAQHVEALASLTHLTQSNSKNPGLRVLRAYVQLELGNATSALKDAKIAENTGDHTPYKCWFLAQVAYLTGDKPLCHREIKHIGADPTYGPDAQNLLRALDGKRK